MRGGAVNGARPVKPVYSTVVNGHAGKEPSNGNVISNRDKREHRINVALEIRDDFGSRRDP
eukprot:4353826-Amphidinium_carterae.1